MVSFGPAAADIAGSSMSKEDAHMDAESRQISLRKQVQFYTNKLPQPRCDSCSDLGKLIADHPDVMIVDVRSSAEQKVRLLVMLV